MSWLVKKSSSGRIALVFSIVALVLALAGTAFSGGSAVPGKNGVKSSDIAAGAVKEAKIANGAVTESKIAGKAVTSGKFFLSIKTALDIGAVPGGACTSVNVPAAGVQSGDHVVVTPPPEFPDTFTLVGKQAIAGNAVTVAVCNQFPSGFVDPDNGGTYNVLVVR